MTKRKKIFVIALSSLAGLLLLLIVSAILVVRTAWFANFVREKIIAVTEQSTGGTVELGSFQFDWTHLTVRIRNFVLHGTEPAGRDPLVRVPLLELRLKLFTGLKHMVDLEYLGVQRPQVDLIVFPNGKTNIPEPKIKKKPSQTSGLQTVVDLAIHRFQIENGLLEFEQQKSAFNARGENLLVLLNYNIAHPSYQGNLRIDPLLLTSGNKPPLGVHVDLPVTIEKDAVRLAGAKLTTDQSLVTLSGSIAHMNAPAIAAQLQARVSLPELQRSFAIPINAGARGAPQYLTADLAVHRGSNNDIQVRTARVTLGQTTFQASGEISPQPSGKSVQFNANLDLAELGSLFKLTSARPDGVLLVNGTAGLDAHKNYAVNGTIDSRNLSLRSGTTRLSDINLFAPFHADPYLISLDGLKLNALGGSLAAKVFVENLRRLSVEGTLHNFSLPVLAAAFTGKRLAYNGIINGTLKAQGNLKAKGASAYRANAELAIAPVRGRGVPVNGRLRAAYNGVTGNIDLARSYIAFPNSRLDLSGSLNRWIDLALVSHNLNDFLPAANFASSGKPQTALPVALHGGTANVEARITGKLTAPHIQSHLAVDRFTVEQRRFDRLSLDLAASPSGASIQNGLLTRNTLQTNFDASIGLVKWKPLPRSPLSANVSLRNGNLADLMTLAGKTSVAATGDLTADVHIRGSYGNPVGSAVLQVLHGSIYRQPFDRLYANVNLSDQLVTLSTLELSMASERIGLSGTFQHPRDSFTTGHAQLHLTTSNVQLANLQALQQQGQGIGGLIQLTADAALDVRKVNDRSQLNVSNVNLDLSAHDLRIQNQSAGDLTATARTVNGAVNYQVSSNFAGSKIAVNGRTVLAKDYPTSASAAIHNLSIEKTLQITGQSQVPARGTLTADAHLSGTLQAPQADLAFLLSNANLYQEPINRLQGAVDYSNTAVNIPAINLDLPAGSISLNGSFTHPTNDFKTGALRLKVDSTNIQLSKIHHVEYLRPGTSGIVRFAADLAATMDGHASAAGVHVSYLNADASASDLRTNNRDLGKASLTATTTGHNVQFRLDSDIAQSQIHGSGQVQLAADLPVHASLAFSNIKYSNIAPFISSEPSIRPSFDGLVEGQAVVNGPALNIDKLNARLQLTRLAVQSVPRGSVTGAPPGPTVALQNEGPIVVALNHSSLNIQSFHIRGPQTSVNASGTVDLKSRNSPLNVNFDAHTNLQLLQDINRDFYSSGTIAAQAVIHGNFVQPLVNGKIELANANLNYADLPNGLSNANGTILLNGTSANIQSLTGETGGGKISASGFVGFTGRSISYNLRTTATRVRVRYSGASIVSSAAISLVGSSRRSLLSGRVTIQRITYASQSDAGSLLSSASAPPSTPTTPSRLLTGMRLDIAIVTAPELRVVTTYANRLTVFANLEVRGTAANPGILGVVRVTDGELVFFGNEYTVNTGTVNFYNPNAIAPVLNISLQTTVQNVNVTIGVSGPMDDLKLSYRSDPPLTFEEIVELLATNKTPTSDPTIAAQQPTPPQQSFSQMGESALLGQAVANPIANRIQRVFGVSQFKIDPSFQGSNGTPTARVTLQQQIASNLTFTYITDVTQTNSEIVRVQWDLTPRFSALAFRDWNGIIGVEFLYKFTVR